jgi:UPF0042 nucleotide-binding protein
VRLVILTGISGAGRTAALRTLEDLGYFGVDNLPPALLTDLARRCQAQGDIEHMAVVMDLRAGHFFDTFPEAIAEARAAGFQIEVIYFDATEDALIKRFKETRRKHPLFEKAGSVAASITLERTKLAPVRDVADRVIDTSRLTTRDLAADLRARYATENRPGGLQITVVSFGFKYGLPIDADLVFDLRFLRNPHWEPALRSMSGLDQAVRDYIDEDPRAETFLKHIEDLLAFAVPCYRDEGKAYLTVGIGCTGGQHRSVYFGERITDFLKSLGYWVTLTHRELAYGG